MALGLALLCPRHVSRDHYIRMGKNSAFSITRRNVSPNQKRHHCLQMQMSLSNTNDTLQKRCPQERRYPSPPNMKRRTWGRVRPLHPHPWGCILSSDSCVHARLFCLLKKKKRKRKKERNLTHYRSDPIRELLTCFEGIFSSVFKGIRRTLFYQQLSL